MTGLSARVLNRTLLHRQHLLERTDAAPSALVRHLVGLQAQDPLPPYLSLAARLERFNPHEVTAGLQSRSLVRLLTLRGTVHLLVPDDALTLRAWVQPLLDGQERSAQNVGSAREIERGAFADALSVALADGPLPGSRLGERLAADFRAYSPGQLGQLARLRGALVQLPPRGCWKESGGVVYDYVDRWAGNELPAREHVDAETLVRRYLTAFGPATALDVTAWSGVTRLAPVIKAMAERGELARHEDERGAPLYDVPGGVLLDADVPAPVRLLGLYDNLWLSHAGRARVTEPDRRRRWMGPNGGLANTVFVDGMLEGLWRIDAGRVVGVETFRTLTGRERSELDDEIGRVEALLAVPVDSARA